jgi:peptidoglycan-associated lipoprotein
MRYQHVRSVALVALLGTLAGACSRKKSTTPAPMPTNTSTTISNDASESDRAAAEARARAERERAEAERRAMALRERMETRIYFNLDRSDLTSQARAILDEKVEILRSVPESRIRITGHADERGADEYNMALGQRRAAAARRYLAQHGIDVNRIETVSLGEEEPVCTEAGESCWSRNRRDEFHITTWAPLASRP